MAIFQSDLDKEELTRRLRRGFRIPDDVIEKVKNGGSLDINDLLNVREQLERQGFREDRDFSWKE